MKFFVLGVGKRLLSNELRDNFPMSRGGTTYWVFKSFRRRPDAIKAKDSEGHWAEYSKSKSCSGKAGVVEMT